MSKTRQVPDRKMLRVFAGLIALPALRNVLRPLGFDMGIVFFGHSLEGAANAIVAPLLGAGMLAYAYGLWHQRRFALPLGIAYAAYAVVNASLFPLFSPLPGGAGAYLAFSLIAAGIPAAAAVVLYRNRHRLR